MMEIPQFRPGQITTLTDLSNEILCSIAEYVSNQEPRISIFFLSRCSRRLHQISQPFFNWEFEEDTTWPVLPTASNTLQNFMRRILARPDIARGVTKYKGAAGRFRDENEDNAETGLDISTITDTDWVRIRAAVNDLEPDGIKTSLWDIERGSWEAMMTVILSLLPNLRDLELLEWPPYGDVLPSLSTFLARAADCQNGIHRPLAPPPSSLAFLTRVILSYGDTEGGMGLNELVPFMKLRSLKYISAHMVSDGDNYNDRSEEENEEVWSGLDSNVIDIYLSYSAIEHGVLSKCLHGCPRLQKFHYEHGGSCVGHASFLPPMLMLALQQVQGTLEVLKFNNYDGDMGFHELERYPFGSFATFPNLKHITVELANLLGRDVDSQHDLLNSTLTNIYPRKMTLSAALPPNLETLTLDSCLPTQIPALFELLSHITNFPHLNHLAIQWCDVPYNQNYDTPFTHPGFTPADLQTFKTLCAAAGIELKLSGGKLRTKRLYHWYDRNIPLVGEQKPEYRQREMEHPYEGWEELCAEFECDPATGFRFDLPFGMPVVETSGAFTPYAIPHAMPAAYANPVGTTPGAGGIYGAGVSSYPYATGMFPGVANPALPTQQPLYAQYPSGSQSLPQEPPAFIGPLNLGEE